MKQITLTKLEMRNFKGCAHQKTEFNCDLTRISGRNGAGKSRHADAFLWCLTGKDALNRKDYEVKSRNLNAETTDKVEVRVELTLSIDGQPTKLTRCLVEKWETPKGQEIEVYRGNKTECYWDDVPVSVTEYEKRINAIVDSEVFKMVTNPFYFTEILDWKARRAILAQMVNVTNADAANGNVELIKLLSDMSGKSEEDFKKWLAAQIAPLKNKPKEIEARIKEVYELMPQNEDWATIESEIRTEEEELELAQVALSDLKDSKVAFTRQKAEYEGEIRKYKDEIKSLVRDAKAEAEADYNNDKRTYEACEFERTKAKQTIETNKQAIANYEDMIAQATATITTAAKEKESLAQEYDAVKQGEGKCPTCGGNMTDELAGKLLPGIVERIDRQNENINKAETLRAKFLDNITECKAKIAEAEELLTAPLCPKPKKKVIEENEIEGILDLKDNLANTENLLAVLLEGTNTDDVKEAKSRIEALQESITALRVRLAARQTIADYEARIDELKDEVKKVAAERAQLERMQYNLMQLQYAKAKLIQERVNGLFTNVQFKMFTTTIEGNIVETCIPLIKGAHYDSANSAGKLNAGLDIINTLSKVYEVTAPIWIDNAEGVNAITHTDAQQIHLIVTDTDLTIS